MNSWTYKGRVRFHPEVTALSMWMSIKCGIFDLPSGREKGVNRKNILEIGQKSMQAGIHT
ncbi:Glu/Leu/Phe/Val dehydrogenase dimerization domain-containing protein [Peribacillus sp. Bi96]|uniref:Glu/Leu/Phe/Val dehydrogenase dimerization domain-containing protein n=1 Tax=Peribacillus sp. Bi96 TaxID=2884273 RepID=UPI0033B04860